jgi:hypothetical protein
MASNVTSTLDPSVECVLCYLPVIENLERHFDNVLLKLFDDIGHVEACGIFRYDQNKQTLIHETKCFIRLIDTSKHNKLVYLLSTVDFHDYKLKPMISKTHFLYRSSIHVPIGIPCKACPSFNGLLFNGNQDHECVYYHKSECFKSFIPQPPSEPLIKTKEQDIHVQAPLIHVNEPCLQVQVSPAPPAKCRLIGLGRSQLRSRAVSAVSVKNSETSFVVLPQSETDLYEAEFSNTINNP